MSLLTTLRKDKMQALKDKDSLKNGVCSLLISAIALAEKEKGSEISDVQALSFVQRELKQTKDTLAQTPKDRKELIEETKSKIAIIESYLPAQMSDEEIETAIKAIMEKLNLGPIAKSRGMIMKEMLSQYAGKTDGKRISEVLAKLIK
ncbi:MAG: hypothetical protein EOM50_08015 [Erysipelotrichia bacterium]|nr:hypothetical protein [Erysipelotrichia bacterium]NCC55282.1 hypothetical protein [Erysipelotrichia bacterium]